MKKTIAIAALVSAILLLSAYSCGQNGPTPASVTLSWTQAVPPTGSSIAFNCVYRSAGAASVPVPPALYCSTAPITSYTDTVVTRSQTYVYAVTATVSGSAESAYSNTASASVPATPGNIAPPVQSTPKEAKLSKPPESRPSPPSWGGLMAVVHAGS